jgi:hypothetical protein
VNINLCTEFSLQVQKVWKQQEVSAMIWLARINNRRRKHKQTYRKEDKTYRKRLQRKHRPSGFTRSSPLMRLCRIIWNTPNAEIPKRNFSLLNKNL